MEDHFSPSKLFFLLLLTFSAPRILARSRVTPPHPPARPPATCSIYRRPRGMNRPPNQSLFHLAYRLSSPVFAVRAVPHATPAARIFVLFCFVLRNRSPNQSLAESIARRTNRSPRQSLANSHLSTAPNFGCAVPCSAPQGLRAYLRAALRYTNSKVTAPYVVHELADVPYLHGDVVPPPEEFHVDIEQDYR